MAGEGLRGERRVKDTERRRSDATAERRHFVIAQELFVHMKAATAGSHVPVMFKS